MGIRKEFRIYLGETVIYPYLHQLVNLGYLKYFKDERAYEITNEGREFLNVGMKELKSLSNFLSTDFPSSDIPI